MLRNFSSEKVNKLKLEIKKVEVKNMQVQSLNQALNTFLTDREWKGYVFEIEVQNILSNLGFDYEANPINKYEWKHNNVKHKVDVTLANGLKIECKHIDGRVYPSWFVRDWKSKGNCAFVFKGDLKLSPTIIQQYHPILVHYSLLHVYLRYKHPLLGTVTSLIEAISEGDLIEDRSLTTNIEEANSKKVEAETVEVKGLEAKTFEAGKSVSNWIVSKLKSLKLKLLAKFKLVEALSHFSITSLQHRSSFRGESR